MAEEIEIRGLWDKLLFLNSITIREYKGNVSRRRVYIRIIRDLGRQTGKKVCTQEMRQTSISGGTSMLQAEGITASIDDSSRAFDNIFVERLWRFVKYEEVYLEDYVTVKEAIGSLGAYFRFYNERRPH